MYFFGLDTLSVWYKVLTSPEIALYVFIFIAIIAIIIGVLWTLK